MAIALPKIVCVLDIETGPTSFKNPEESRLLFAGIMLYTFRNNRYYGRYRYFFPHQSKELEVLLQRLRGIIIGHNILAFDYRVLRPLLSLDGVVEKTVDTLALLYRKMGLQVKGLSLKKLAEENLQLRKVYLGEEISRVWHSARRRKAVHYNKMDCRVTMALWWKLVKARTIRITYDDEYDGRIQESLRLSMPDIHYLVGKKPLYSYHSWQEQIERKGYVLRRKGITYPVYYWFYCSKCRMTYLFESQILTGYASKEFVSCPKCRLDLGEIRADVGYAEVGATAISVGDGHAQRFIPEPFKDVLLRYLQSSGRALKGVQLVRYWKTQTKQLGNNGIERLVDLSWLYCNRCGKTGLIDPNILDKMLEGSAKDTSVSCSTCNKRSVRIGRSGENIFIGEKEWHFGKGRSLIRDEFYILA